ncbi:hypothetical protein AV530_012910 [Patagioenas fasciata monilis]|uniref:Uncharacterized protein n=1 Tax=Patagioenas fasciata monilis TaxID=372326 RepID=A0A1V4J9Q7_PATFA|nr:hypothetical protein AV530_012910 [Patagioenas fasciata monilis]
MRDTNRAHSSQLLPGESAYRRAPGFFNTIATDTYIQTVFLVTNEGTLKSSSFKTADMTEHQQCRAIQKVTSCGRRRCAVSEMLVCRCAGTAVLLRQGCGVQS